MHREKGLILSHSPSVVPADTVNIRVLPKNMRNGRLALPLHSNTIPTTSYATQPIGLNLTNEPNGPSAKMLKKRKLHGITSPSILTLNRVSSISKWKLMEAWDLKK